LSDDPRLTTGDKKVWDDFCQNLENREAQVAMLYDRMLFELHSIDENTSLEELKEQVENVTEKMTIQKAQFDILAKKAEAKLRRVGL
jgi:hypothetical protein